VNLAGTQLSDNALRLELVRDLERHIQEGGKPFVCLSAHEQL